MNNFDLIWFFKNNENVFLLCLKKKRVFCYMFRLENINYISVCVSSSTELLTCVPFWVCFNNLSLLLLFFEVLFIRVIRWPSFKNFRYMSNSQEKSNLTVTSTFGRGPFFFIRYKMIRLDANELGSLVVLLDRLGICFAPKGTCIQTADAEILDLVTL